MNGLGIGLDSYAQSGTDGFGDYSMGDVQNLNKALTAGDTTGRETTGQQIAGSGAPLKVESLEKSLKILTFKDINQAKASSIGIMNVIRFHLVEIEY